MKYLKRFNESKVKPVLLNLEDNVDMSLMNIISRETKLGQKVLEISCGNGADSKFMSDKGYDVTCTEMCDEYVDNAIELGLNCIKQDTKELFRFSENEFDIIYCRLGLHYFSEVELNNIFSELKRIGRKILFTVKIENDKFNTNKIILSVDNWRSIVSRFFDIKIFKNKTGNLYNTKSSWLEILGYKKESKAGLIPYIKQDGIIKMLFFIPSDPKFGGDKLQIAKGMIDENEDIETAALREASEELGLKMSNVINTHFVTKDVSKGTDSSYNFHLYVSEIKDINDFNKFHYETLLTKWLTIDEFKRIGRENQIPLVIQAYNKIKKSE